jgi:hypothetical protein
MIGKEINGVTPILFQAQSKKMNHNGLSQH